MPPNSFLTMRLNTVSKTNIPVLVVFGATASGKTALVERIFAQNTQSSVSCAEIISADSMQVYEHMNIGTAKPSSALLERLPHHLIDIFSPKQQFTSGEFVRRADEACADIFSRGKLPVIVGGTAFYIRNFLYGLPKTPQADESTRAHLQQELRQKGARSMHSYLAQLDPKSAERIHLNDEYRILRALEVCVASGRPLSSFLQEQNTRAPYRFAILAIDRPRQELNERIENRVDTMITQGLAQEFLALVAAGFTQDDPGMQAIGYREFFTAGFGTIKIPPHEALEKARELIKSNSKKYAKRQNTFFKSIPNVRRIHAEDTAAVLDAVKQLYK